MHGEGEGLEFEPWYRTTHASVVASLVLVTGDLDAAREAGDEAFVRAFERWDRVSQMASPRGWVYRVALNVARRRGRRAMLEANLWRRRAEVSAGSAIPEDAIDAWVAVAALPRRQREAVVLRYVADLTEVEVATVLRVRRSTISRSLDAAHKTLAARLEAPRCAG